MNLGHHAGHRNSAAVRLLRRVVAVREHARGRAAPERAYPDAGDPELQRRPLELVFSGVEQPGRVGIRPARAAADERQQARPVRRRRAELARQRLGGLRRAVGPDVPRRLRGRPAQPGRADPLRGARRTRRRARRAHLFGVARSRSPDARTRHPAVHRRCAPAGRRVRHLRHLVLDRTRLHQHAQCARPRRHPDRIGRSHRRAPAGDRRWSCRIQPRADRRFHRRRSARRRRAGGHRDHAHRARMEARRLAGWARRSAVPVGAHRQHLRAAFLRRDLSRRRSHRRGHAESRGRACAGFEAHADGSRRVAVPEEAPGTTGRNRARAVQRRDLPRLHARVPVLSGRHDYPASARALDRHDRRDGRCRPEGERLPRSRAAVTQQRRPLRDRPAGQATGRPLRGNEHLVVVAVDASRRVQRRPRQRVLPQRPPLRPDVRTRRRQRAHAQGHQQDGDRGRPDPHGDHRLRPGLASGEALLHVRAADRDRRRRAANR